MGGAVMDDFIVEGPSLVDFNSFIVGIYDLYAELYARRSVEFTTTLSEGHKVHPCHLWVKKHLKFAWEIETLNMIESNYKSMYHLLVYKHVKTQPRMNKPQGRY